jgi:hypothetical protein
MRLPAVGAGAIGADAERLVPTVAGSETLKARGRTIRDDLAEAVGRDAADPGARLAASLLLAT